MCLKLSSVVPAAGCCICLGTFKDKEDLYQLHAQAQGQATHELCTTCFLRLIANNNTPPCPMCRHPVEVDKARRNALNEGTNKRGLQVANIMKKRITWRNNKDLEK